MNGLRALRSLLRVELREIRRHPARAWLVMLLVAVPVAGVVGGGALHHIVEPTPEEQRVAAMGRADLRIDDLGDTDLAAARAMLPEGTRVESLRAGRVEVVVPARRLTAAWRALEPQGLARGMALVTAGRAPTAPDEVALTPVLLEALARTSGDTVTLLEEDGRSSVVTITGTVVVPEQLAAAWVLRASSVVVGPANVTLLIDLPEDSGDAAAATLAARLRRDGHSASARSEHGHHDLFGPVVILVVGGFASAEAALIIAAAFVVGLRRRQREIGLLAATGASAGMLRLAVLASAATLAGGGVVLGTLSGLGGAAALHPFLDAWNGRLNGPFEFWWPHALAALVLGVGTAVAAAALPAVSITRLPVRLALAGRRPVRTPSRVWLRAAAILFGAGVAAMLLATGRPGPVEAFGVLAGSIVAMLGLAASSPWLLDVAARFAGPLPLDWRLAVRDAGRFRSRNGPVVAAILGGVSVCVMLAALMSTIEAALVDKRPTLRDDQLLLSGAEAESVARWLVADAGGAVAARLSAVHVAGAAVELPAPDGEAGSWIACGDTVALAALGVAEDDRDVGADQILALRAADDERLLGAEALGGVPALSSCEVKPVLVAQAVRSPVWFLPAAAAEARGLALGPPPGHDLHPWIVRFEREVTESQVARARALAEHAAATFVDAERLHRVDSRAFLRVVLAITLLTGLVVIGVATALSSAESAADARVLHAVGAAPGVLRGHLAARAGYLALLGGVLAVPAGLLPVIGLLPAANLELQLTLPWVELGIVTLGLPWIAWGGTWLFAAATGPPRGPARVPS